MHRCIYTLDFFETADGEHILQNSLGARWTSSVIASNKAQEFFGSSIDVALANGLKEIRNTLGTRGGRNDPGPTLKKVSGSDGSLFTIEPGGKVKISEPTIKAIRAPNGMTHFQVRMGNKNQLEWAIRKIKTQYPDHMIDEESIRGAMLESGKSKEYIKHKIVLGGDEFFRGALKSIFNLLGVSNPDIACSASLNDVREFILHGRGESKSFVRWITSPEPLVLPSIGNFDHFLAVYSNKGKIDGYIQFFGGIGYSLRLAEIYDGPDFQYGYLVDPFREGMPAEARNPDYCKEQLPSFDLGSVLAEPNVQSAMASRFSALLQNYYERIDRQNLNAIVEDVLGPADGQPITKEQLDELSRRTAEYFIDRASLPPSKDDWYEA